MRRVTRRWIVGGLLLVPGPAVAAQQIEGRVLDGASGQPIPAASLHLLDAERTPLLSSAADASGAFVIGVPGAGEYFLVAEHLSYPTTTSPLLAVADSGVRLLDMVLRADPIELSPLDVTVRNDAIERWSTLRGHEGRPTALFGYRLVQGQRVAEALERAGDNTDFLRWLYIPVSHARSVCISTRSGCAHLYVDDVWQPSELLESLDLDAAVAVVVLPWTTRPPEVHVFTRAYDWGGVGRMHRVTPRPPVR